MKTINQKHLDNVRDAHEAINMISALITAIGLFLTLLWFVLINIFFSIIGSITPHNLEILYVVVPFLAVCYYGGTAMMWLFNMLHKELSPTVFERFDEVNDRLLEEIKNMPDK